MHSKIIGLIAMGMMSSMAFAEPAIQPGDTLESLSKARITTSVNTQAVSPTTQTSVASNTNAEVKVEDIDPIIEEKTAQAETVKVAVQPVTQTTVEAVVAPVVSDELSVSVADIDVAHPTE